MLRRASLSHLVQAAYGHYVEYDRRRHGDAGIVDLRKQLGRDTVSGRDAGSKTPWR